MISTRFALNLCEICKQWGEEKIHNNNMATQKANIFGLMYIFSFYSLQAYLWSPKTIEGLFIFRKKNNEIR